MNKAILGLILKIHAFIPLITLMILRVSQSLTFFTGIILVSWFFAAALLYFISYRILLNDDEGMYAIGELLDPDEKKEYTLSQSEEFKKYHDELLDEVPQGEMSRVECTPKLYRLYSQLLHDNKIKFKADSYRYTFESRRDLKKARQIYLSLETFYSPYLRTHDYLS